MIVLGNAIEQLSFKSILMVSKINGKQCKQWLIWKFCMRFCSNLSSSITFSHMCVAGESISHICTAASISELPIYLRKIKLLQYALSSKLHLKCRRAETHVNEKKLCTAPNHDANLFNPFYLEMMGKLNFLDL